MAETRFVRNDTDGSLKAAALQAAVTMHQYRPTFSTYEQVIADANDFYEWLRETR